MPLNTDKFVWREAAQGLEPLGVLVGQQKGLPVFGWLGRGLVMLTPDGRLLGGAVHALHLAGGPGMSGLGQAMFYALFAANAVETVPTGQKLMRLGRERHPVVGQDGMHLVRQLVQHPTQKFGGHGALGAGVAFGKGDFARAVKGHEELLAAFPGLHLGKIDVQVANRTVFGLLFRRALPVFA